MSTYYDEYRNDYYNPDDVEEQPGDNQNWKMIQKGFKDLVDSIAKKLTVNWFNSLSITIEAGTKEQFSIPLTDTQVESLGYGKHRFIPLITISDNPTNFLMSQVVFAKKQNDNDLYITERANLTEGMTNPRFVVSLFNPGTEDITLNPSSLVVSIWLFDDFL